MNKTIEITHKRLNHDEGEMKEFGNFVLQYMPMNLQNIITENLLLSNPNATGLKNLQRLLQTKESEFKIFKTSGQKFLAALFEQEKVSQRNFSKMMVEVEKKGDMKFLEEQKEKINEKLL